MKPRCKHDHPYMASNTKWYTHVTGRTYYICRACYARRSRLRYRCDDDWREKEKTRSRERYQNSKVEMQP